MTQAHDTLKNTIDVVSAIATIGSFLSLLAPVFGLIGAIWTLMRMAEMVTGQSFSQLIGRKKRDGDDK